MAPTPAREWPLVGRARESTILEEAIARRSIGGVVLAGEVGAGKTRLARHTLEIAAADRRPTAWASATRAAAAVPFGAFAHLLPAQPATGASADNVIRAAADALVGDEVARGPLVAVDDAQLLDLHSAALVRHLAAETGAFVVVTHRSDEAVPDAIASLWKDGICERLEVRPLSEEAVGELLELALGDEVEGATKRRLYTHSAGNPLFLRELVLAGLDSGALLFVDGLWSWEGPFKPSPRLAELIGRRLEGFSPEATRALELIALGEPVPVAILESLVERADLSELEQGRVVAEGVEGARRFARLAHPMYGEMVRAGVAPARAREVAAELAGAFASTGARRRDDLLRVATWRLEAGLSEEPGVLAAAAQQALALTDFELAEQLSRAAVGGGAPEAGEVLARSLVGQGRFEEADDLLAGIERAVGSRLERVAVSSARAHNLLWNLSEYDRSLDVLDTAASEVSDPGTRLTLDAVKSYFLWLTGRAEDAIGSGLAILEDPLAGDLAVFHSFSAVGQASIFAGHPDRALDLLERHRERLQRVLPQVAFGPIAFAILEASAGLMSGSLGDARGSLEQRYREALERDAEWVRALIGGLLGAVIRAQGRVTPAARLLRESAALLRRNDVIGQLQAVLSELAVALAESGDAEGAAEALHEAEERTALPPLRVYLSQARIWVLAAQGSVREAIASAQEEADELASMGLLGGASLALHASVRLGAPGPVADRLDDLTAGSDSELLLTMSTHATALARRDAAGLEEVASRYEAMPALLLAAEALAQAADLHRRASRAARAHVSTRRALRLLAECPGAATPALQGLGAALPLSAREREVATLAARGLSNKEIAEQLHISIRTVGNHLHRTYRRLGIAGRKELEELI